MKTDFIPLKFFGPTIDPGSVAGAVGGATPWGAIAQGAVGLAQTIGGWIQQRKATKQLQNLQSPTYTPNQSIMDYYNNALQRYNVDPTQSALYKRNKKNILSGTAQGVGSLQSMRAGQSGIPALIRAQNDAMLNNEVAAENQKNQRFNQLGQATTMKAGEDRTAFNYNQQQPFERKYNLLAAKAGGGAQIMNAGISNIYGAGENLSQRDLLKKYYSQ